MKFTLVSVACWFTDAELHKLQHVSWNLEIDACIAACFNMGSFTVETDSNELSALKLNFVQTLWNKMFFPVSDWF